ncbi:hypothetical protein EBB07_10295 [Paenibacillaceae bacterium]|nr:hypothetical protein EBB07_10295 [Paenibacillaceae bacterium]
MWRKKPPANSTGSKQTQSKSGESSSSTSKAITILEYNFKRLSAELSHIGTQRKVAVLGQPGAGKSTLLDRITEQSCHPRPDIGQQTDATNWSRHTNCILLRQCDRIVLADVPGYDTAAHPLDTFLNHFPFASFDCLLLVLKGKVHEADDRLWQWLKRRALTDRTLVVRAFAEGLTAEEQTEVRADLHNHFGHAAALCSSREMTGLTEVRKFVYGLRY